MVTTQRKLLLFEEMLTGRLFIYGTISNDLPIEIYQNLSMELENLPIIKI